jgi:hypothetical protein
MRAGVSAGLLLAAWLVPAGRAEAVLVDVVGTDQATGALVTVAGDLETPSVTSPSSGLGSTMLALSLSVVTDPIHQYGPLFANVTVWQPSTGSIDVPSSAASNGTLSGTGTDVGSESASGSGASSGLASRAANGAGAQGTIDGVIGTPSTGTIDGTTGSTGSGSLEGTIGPIATVTIQGTVTGASPIPLPASAALFAAGAAAWAGWARWMRRAGRE